MSTDGYTRFVLALIALALVLLVAQGFGLGSGARAGRDDDGRYRMAMTAGFVLRMNLQTGETWTMPLRSPVRQWVRVPEPDEPAPAPAEVP